jgi:hypothetical protein
VPSTQQISELRSTDVLGREPSISLGEHVCDIDRVYERSLDHRDLVHDLTGRLRKRDLRLCDESSYNSHQDWRGSVMRLG